MERKPGETSNDRNDRAIRVATQWYTSHVSAKNGTSADVKVILLTNDIDNLKKAQDDGLEAFTSTYA